MIKFILKNVAFEVSRDDLITIEAEDVFASRVFQGEIEGQDPSQPLTTILDAL